MTPSSQSTRVFVVLNPVAGSLNAQELPSLITDHFNTHDIPVEIYQTTGKENENLPEIVQSALERGFTLFIAAGGDGRITGAEIRVDSAPSRASISAK